MFHELLVAAIAANAAAIVYAARLIVQKMDNAIAFGCSLESTALASVSRVETCAQHLSDKLAAVALPNCLTVEKVRVTTDNSIKHEPFGRILFK